MKGPWLERAFHREVEKQGIEFARNYLVGYWTDALRKGNGKELDRLFEQVTGQGSCFTVVQHDRGFWREWPSNLLVFGSGGVGDVPLPLIVPGLDKRSSRKVRPYRVSWQGRITNITDRTKTRRRMLNAMKGFPGFVTKAYSQPSAYYKLLGQSDFVLAPRGYGKTSFRMYEAMAMGAVPIYVYTEPWVPYMDKLDWNLLAIFCHADDVASLPSKIESVTSAELHRRRHYIREVYNDYFTVEGIVKQVKEYLDDAG
jgi:hypothetical protein